jgi:hypothetical protein
MGAHVMAEQRPNKNFLSFRCGSMFEKVYFDTLSHWPGELQNTKITPRNLVPE